MSTVCVAIWTRFSQRPGVRSDHTVIVTAIDSATAYPDALRRVTYLDVGTSKKFKFLTNNFTLPAFTIAYAYQCRWQVELFFKWIKQRLRIKAFFGASENAVRTQTWTAVSVYVLVIIVRKTWAWTPASTKFYTFSASPFLKKHPFYGHFKRPTSRTNWAIPAAS